MSGIVQEFGVETSGTRRNSNDFMAIQCPNKQDKSICVNAHINYTHTIEPDSSSIGNSKSECNETMVQLCNSQHAAISCSPSKEQKSDEKKPWTRFQKLTLATMALVNFSAAASFAIISPFFPKEAKRKGATETEVGFIFGIFEFVIFSTAPLFGKYLPKLGCKFMFVSGVFIGGTCSILFGFLDECPDGKVYVVMCFLCRSIEALGCSMFVTASFAIIAGEFPGEVALVFGILETFNGFGMMTGPPLGGALYEAGGYKLPFMLMGGFLIACAVAAYFILPKPDDQLPYTGSLLSLARLPSVMLCCLTVAIAASSLGFLDPTLAGHLDDEFTLTPLWIGIVFLIGPGVYALCAPLMGWIVDKKGWTKSLMCIGCLVSAVSYLLMGPSPWLPWIPAQLWIAVICQVVLGIGVGLSLVPTFQDLISSAKKNGFPSNFDTYGLISGLFNSSFSFGAFLGPTVGGVLIDSYGFNKSTSYVSMTLLAMGFVFLVYWSCMYLCSSGGIFQEQPANSGEKQALLAGVIASSYQSNNPYSSVQM